MEITLSKKQNILIIETRGELDHHNADHFRNKIDETIRKQRIKHVIFDFTDLNFMDSSGIGLIIGRYKLMKAIGGTVSLICSNSRICALIRMSGLLKLVSLYASKETAISTCEEGLA